MKEQSIFVSGSNHFNERDFNKMIELLEQGKQIHIGIDCIGHTKNNMEQEIYKRNLIEHYGDKLEVIYNDGWCSYSYEYKLKEEEL